MARKNLDTKDQVTKETTENEIPHDSEQETAELPEESVDQDDLEDGILQEEMDDTTDMWEKIKRQPKVKIMIPSERTHWEGFLNGHSIMIKTNEYVDVPQDIAALIENNQRVIRESEEKLMGFQSRTGVKIAEIG